MLNGSSAHLWHCGFPRCFWKELWPQQSQTGSAQQGLLTFWQEVPLATGCELLSSSPVLLLAEELQGAIKWRGKGLQHQVLA